MRFLKAPRDVKAENTKIKLFGFVQTNPGFDFSPAVTKLATFLKMAQVEFDYIPFKEHQGKGSPKGKMPWVHPSEVGVMGDSTLIIRALVEANPSKYDLDTHLSDEQKAIGTAFKIMLEESVYWGIIQCRWLSPEFNRYTVGAYFGGKTILNKLVGNVVRSKIRRDMKGQGSGLHTDAEIVAKIGDEIRAVAAFLGEKKYIMGDQRSSFDATAYAFIAAFLQGDWQHGLCDVARKQENLVAYVDRMHEIWSQP